MALRGHTPAQRKKIKARVASGAKSRRSALKGKNSLFGKAVKKLAGTASKRKISSRVRSLKRGPSSS